MSKDNGGPAFPHLASMDNDENYEVQHNGMTLRDYFAAKALTGFISRNGTASGELFLTAQCAYDFADAMLKARAQ